MLEPGETLGQDVSWETSAVAQLSDDESGVQRAPPCNPAEGPPEVDTPPPPQTKSSCFTSLSTLQCGFYSFMSLNHQSTNCEDMSMSVDTDCCEEVKSLGCVRLFVTPYTVASQAPLSMGFFRQ